MMRVVAGLMVLLLWSCSSKTKVPDRVLPVKEMQSVLWDLVRADVMVANQVARDSSIHKLERSTDFYQQIFAVHHITKGDFQRSLQFYKTRPDLLQPIYDSLYNKDTTVTPLPHHPPIVK